jgi:hypothetical protein
MDGRHLHAHLLGLSLHVLGSLSMGILSDAGQLHAKAADHLIIHRGKSRPRLSAYETSMSPNGSKQTQLHAQYLITFLGHRPLLLTDLVQARRGWRLVRLQGQPGFLLIRVRARILGKRGGLADKVYLGPTSPRQRGSV